MKDKFKKMAAELAVEILMEAELDDAAEQGEITVDPDLLFRFYVLMNNTK